MKVTKYEALRHMDDGRTQCLDSDTAVLSGNYEKDPGWNTGLNGRILFCLEYKDFLKYTKENMPSDHFGCNFLQEGQINLIPSPDCCIFIAVSEDTYIGHP